MSLEDALGTLLITAWFVLVVVFVSDAYALAAPAGFWSWTWFLVRLVLGGLWTGLLSVLLLGVLVFVRGMLFLLFDEEIYVHNTASFVACFGLVIFLLQPLWSWIF